MTNIATQLQGVRQTVGIVSSDSDGELLISTDEGEFNAKRAVSCLVSPVAGDMVLLSVVERAGCYVLAVLEREDDAQATTIRVDGDLSVNLASGSFTVAAQEGVNFASAKDVSVVSQGVHVNAVEGSVVMQRLSYIGGMLRTEIDKVKNVAGTRRQRA